MFSAAVATALSLRSGEFRHPGGRKEVQRLYVRLVAPVHTGAYVHSLRSAHASGVGP